jgi:hypothetical protein
MILKEGYEEKSREDEEEDVHSYCMTLRKEKLLEF